MNLFNRTSFTISKIVTQNYSTSFSLGIQLLDKELRDPIYGVYGFVRFADEIVDTFHEFDKAYLLSKFRNDTFEAIETGISLNPVLQSFQLIVNKYKIDLSLIHTFLDSMEMDLNKTNYTKESYEKYILGSAEVVGLMCLKIFCNGNQEIYEKLTPEAMKLGSAFQKINFLRDLDADYIGMGRIYFPNIEMKTFDDENKIKIEKDILIDFKKGFEGIKKLPKAAQLGVHLAYMYYLQLFYKIKKVPAKAIIGKRIRISNRYKLFLLIYCYISHKFNLIGK